MEVINIVFTFDYTKVNLIILIYVYSEMSKTELNLTVDHQWTYQEYL